MALPFLHFIAHVIIDTLFSFDFKVYASSSSNATTMLPILLSGSIADASYTASVTLSHIVLNIAIFPATPVDSRLYLRQLSLIDIITTAATSTYIDALYFTFIYSEVDMPPIYLLDIAATFLII